MLTVAEAARHLDRSIEQVGRYVREGKLRGRRIGRQWSIDASSLGTADTPQPPLTRGMRERAAIMEPPKMSKREGGELFQRIDGNREAIRRRLGGDAGIDVVEMPRRRREEH